GICGSWASGGGGGVSCWDAAAWLCGSAMCCCSATGAGAGVSRCGAAASLCCTGSTGAVAAGRFSVKGGAGTSSAADGPAMELEAGDVATQGMPRRAKQLGAKGSQLWLEALDGESEG